MCAVVVGGGGSLDAEYRFDAINCPYNLMSQSAVIMGHALPPPYDAASPRAPARNKRLAISDLTGQDKSTSQCGIIFSFGFVSPPVNDFSPFIGL